MRVKSSRLNKSGNYWLTLAMGGSGFPLEARGLVGDRCWGDPHGHADFHSGSRIRFVIVLADHSVTSCLAELGELSLLQRLYGAVSWTSKRFLSALPPPNSEWQTRLSETCEKRSTGTKEHAEVQAQGRRNKMQDHHEGPPWERLRPRCRPSFPRSGTSENRSRAEITESAEGSVSESGVSEDRVSAELSTTRS